MDLIEKLIKIQSELKAPKGQYNDFGKYKYRSCEDIFESLKPLLKEYQLVLQTNDELLNIGDRYYIKATATLTDLDGSSISNTGYAREEDTKKGMDGSQITGASSSYARKYALNGLFLIDDTKDSDATNIGNKEEALTYTFKSGKHANESIKQVIETGDIEYLQNLLDNDKTKQTLKEKIKLAADLVETPIPGEKEQTEILFLTNEINELLSKVEDPDKVLKGRKTKGMGLADLIILKNELEKEVK